jgi:predicted permease
MKFLKLIFTRLYALFYQDRVERDMEDEIRFHIQMRTKQYIEQGLTPEAAARAAAQRFGNISRIKESCREFKGAGLLETLAQDLRFGIRLLIKKPTFAIVAILSLALGIGANTAIFSLISTILLRPLPFANPEQVVSVFPVSEKNPSAMSVFSYPDYRDFRNMNQALAGLAVYRFAPISLSKDGNNERVWSYLVSGNYFDLLGVKPIYGRAFAPEEDRKPNANPVVVMSYGCWQRRFGGAADVIGKNIILNGHNFTVIGIAPKDFKGTELIFTPEFWLPSMMQSWIEPNNSNLEGRGDGQWLAVGRLKPDLNITKAEAELNLIADRLGKEYPQTDEGMKIKLIPPGLVFPSFRDSIIGFAGVLMMTVILVLMIACTNLANLQLARAIQRRKEIAVRLALGASRLRLIRQLLTESVTLSIFGGIIGLLPAYLIVYLVEHFKPPIDFNLTIDLKMDWRVFSFTMLLSLITGIGFGLLPALQATKPDMVTTLKDDASTKGYRRSLLRNGLVVAQVCLSLVLLISAGLIVRSLQQVRMIGPGFQTEQAMLFSVDLGLQGYDEAKGREFYRQIVANVMSVPGARSAAFTSTLPLSLDISSTGVGIEGEPPERGANIPQALYNSTGPNYFAAMGIPFIAGRDFTDQDKKGSTPVAIVNETFAHRFWPGQNAVGKRFNSGDKNDPWVEVIGVVKDGKYFSLGEDPKPFIYFSLWQQYSSSATLIVRGAGDSITQMNAIKSEIQKLDSSLPIFGVKTMSQHMSLSLFPIRIGAAVVGSFGLLALILAAMGIYGVMAYSVNQRAKEIGIRMALGAQAGDVLKLVLGQGMMLTFIGMALGLIAAFGLSRILSTMLYGVSATDPTIFCIVIALLGATALLACYIPARRAMKIDPMEALRYQ